jgi:streptogramin lyase
MTIFSKRDDERSLGRADGRKSRRNRLFWSAGPESPRLEPRTMPALTVTTFQIPLVALVEPQGITTGSDGNLWFTENGAGKIGRMTPSGVVTSFALPQVPPPAGSPAGTAATTPHPTDITAGPDGALWFVGIPGEIGRITTTGVVTEFPLPAVPPPSGSKPGTASTPATATSIVEGLDGALWFTGVPGEIGRISMTGAVTEFAVPDVAPGTQATPTSITVGPDGALWFGENGAIGRITTAGKIQQFSLGNSAATVEDITSGPGGELWFIEQFSSELNSLARITTSGAIAEYPGLVPNNVGSMIAGPDGDLWLAEAPPAVGYGNGPYVTICRITPAGIFTAFNVPGNFNTIGSLTPGPGGNVWFTEQEDGRTNGQQPAIGEITPAGVTTLHAIPQSTTLDPSLGVPVNPTAITSGPDGALWFGQNGAIGRITTAGAIEQFPLPNPAAMVDNIVTGPDGDLWFVQAVWNSTGNYDTDSIGRITPTGKITTYSLPEDSSADVTAGPDGNVWFTETVTNPTTNATTSAIGRITPEGQIQTFALPGKLAKNASLANIALGRDGNLWFPVGVGTKAAIGRVTATGKITMYGVPSTASQGSYHMVLPNPPSDLISGSDGELWYGTTVGAKAGIARISTKGKLASFIPTIGGIGNLVALPSGQVWFDYGNALGVATRSGILATQDLPPAISALIRPGGSGFYGLTLGPDGNVWGTIGSSSIVRIGGLDTLAGGLDYRHRPPHPPDAFTNDYDYFSWTNVTSETRPTFAGVARPGAQVTLWAQKQGHSQPVFIGQTAASNTDGSWTLKSKVKLSNGNYAVTASQTGDTGPPSVFYSMANPLVIQASHGG